METTTQHTPGPWTVGGPASCGNYSTLEIRGGGFVLAHTFDSYRNAQLISQAPALLAKLQELDAVYDRVSRLKMPMELVRVIMESRALLAVNGWTNPTA